MLHKDTPVLFPSWYALQGKFSLTTTNFHNESKIMKYINSRILGTKDFMLLYHKEAKGSRVVVTEEKRRLEGREM
jgi:hypothetical protein